MHTHAPSRATQGFTLVELMVAIAIIGVLALVLISTYNAAQKRGFDAAALKCGKAIIDGQTQFRVLTGAYFAGLAGNLNEDVQEACQGVQVQPWTNPFTPGPTTSGNGQVGLDSGNQSYNFWVWHLRGGRSYYTWKGGNMTLQESNTW